MRFSNYLIESINDKAIFKCLVMVGPPGSGKSTIISRVLSDGAYPIKVISTDRWTDIYKGDYFTHVNNIKRLTSSEFINYINSLLPFIMDTVSADKFTFEKRVSILKSFGYDINAMFIDIPYQISLNRVKQRNAIQHRKVDIGFLEDAYKILYGSLDSTSIKGSDIYSTYKRITGNTPIVMRNEDELEWGPYTKQIYNTVMRFFNSPLKNKKGRMLIEYMKKNGYKYYKDVPEDWIRNNGYPLLKEMNYYG